VEKTIQLAHGGLNPAIVGKSAKKIAELAGIKVPNNCRVLISETDGVGQAHPFSREKLAPLLGFYTVDDWEEGCEMSIDILNYGGLGHSLGIHSKNEEVIRAFALKKPTSRILVNTPTALGATGATTNLAPSMTLGCGSKGGNATSDNITPLNLFDRRRIAYGVRDLETKQTKITDFDLKNSGDEELEIIIDKILEKLTQK